MLDMSVERSPSPPAVEDDGTVLVNDTKELKQAVHDEMEAIGCGYFQRRIVTILGLGNVADAVEILAIGYILTVYEDSEGTITAWQSSLLTASVFAGMLVGGFIGGIVGDLYGRKPVLLTTLFINASSAFFSSFSPNIYWLILFRTLAGLGVGGVVSSLFALCLEHVPVSSRGRYITILCCFWMVGSISTAAVAWIMLGNDVHGNRILDISWRWFAAVVGLPSMCCLLLAYYYIPESVHFLASTSQPQKVNAVIQHIHQVNGLSRNVQFQMVDEVDDKSRVKAKVFQSVQASLVPLIFRPPQLRTTVLLMLTAYCLSFGSYGLSTWISKIFQTVGLDNPFGNAFLFAIANLPGNVVSLYLVDRVERRKLLSASFFFSACSTLLFAMNLTGSPTVIVLVSCLFNACVTAAWNTFGVLSAEGFPSEARTTGLSLSNCSGRIGAMCAQFVNGLLIGPPPHIATLLMVTTTVLVVGGTATYFVERPVEIKMEVEKEEIEMTDVETVSDCREEEDMLLVAPERSDRRRKVSME